MKPKPTIIVSLLAISNVLSVWWLTRPTLNEVMGDFYVAKGRAEDMLMDPLILNRDIVRAYVTEEVLDSTMNKRRYAIHFLGNEKINEALPNLDKIVRTKEEDEVFRADALKSAWQIKKEKGIALAKEFMKEPGMVGESAQQILSGKFTPYIRTYEQARSGYHH